MSDDSSAPSNLVTVTGVTKSFDGGRVLALDNVDFTVQSGELVALTGPSGCGKSTLLNMLAALEGPTSGRVQVLGYDSDRPRDVNRFRREDIGLVFQLHNLLPHLTAEQNVAIALMGAGMGRTEQRTRARELLHQVQLDGREHRKPPQLSGGERQRIAIARALANRPALLLADEPTGSLDSESVARTLELFRSLRAETGLTIVMVTHDPLVAATADRLVTMHDGGIATGADAPRVALHEHRT